MINTKIQWADSTLNLQMGCAGCELWNPAIGVKKCYAGVMTERHAGKNGWPEAFEIPKLFPHRLAPALKWSDLTGKVRPDKPWISSELPRTIFLDDMGDTFSESLPIDWLAEHLEKMENCPHIWILLTKRPNRMAEFFSNRPVPSNFWLCTSITNKASLRRIPQILKIENAPVLGLSIEPLWEELDLRSVDGLKQLSWVKIGGESGQNATPCDLDWIQRAADDCGNAGMSVFVKQLGTKAIQNGVPFKLQDYHGGNWDEWPANLRVREMPTFLKKKAA